MSVDAVVAFAGSVTVTLVPATELKLDTVESINAFVRMPALKYATMVTTAQMATHSHTVDQTRQRPNALMMSSHAKPSSIDRPPPTTNITGIALLRSDMKTPNRAVDLRTHATG